jgi:general secretion pathway protein F
MDSDSFQFEVKGFRDGTAGVARLLIAASSPEQARERASAQGYYVLGIGRASNPGATRRGIRRAALPASSLSAELLALLRAGLGLPEAMAALQTRRRTMAASQIIDRLCQALKEGQSFSKALEESGAGFSPLFVATIRSSEETGNLAEALTRYLDYDRRMHAVRNTLISASIYPAILLIVGLAVVGFLLGYVVPRFSRIYVDLGEERIPAASRALMHLGQFIDLHRTVLACGLAGGGLLMAQVLRQPKVRARLNRWAWSVPFIGARLHLYQLARFSHTLAMLLRGGVPFVTSLEMALGLLQLPSLQNHLDAAKRDISEGQPISGSFARHELATEVGVRMLAAGERTGNMAEMMDHVAHLYDEELGQWIERFTRLFEPLLMTAIGVTIGVLVLLMYLPIFGLASSIE